jgi:hypothetical protein
MVGKTFKGLTDELLTWQTERFLDLATDKGDWVVHVRPEQVVEIALTACRPRPLPGGVALRFARVRRYRDDKGPTRPTRSTPFGPASRRVTVPDPVELYERHADVWAALRGPELVIERAWLERFTLRLEAGATVLDAGCGHGDPLARALLAADSTSRA